jgi:hypothetical protein
MVGGTNVNAHPVRPDFGLGPRAEAEELLKERPDFAVGPGSREVLGDVRPDGLSKETEITARE